MHGGFRTQTIRDSRVDFSNPDRVTIDGRPLPSRSARLDRRREAVTIDAIADEARRGRVTHVLHLASRIAGRRLLRDAA